MRCSGFDWNVFGKDNVIVDMGGGIGTVSMAIAKAFLNVNFIVQDLAVLEQGRQARCEISSFCQLYI
jgi:hypothetical protein